MPLPLTCLLNAGFPPFVIAWAKNGEVSVNSDISAEIVAFFGVDRDLPKSAERFDFIARSQRDDATVQLRIILEESSITDVMSYLAKERV
jgi:hypothetical protein